MLQSSFQKLRLRGLGLAFASQDLVGGAGVFMRTRFGLAPLAFPRPFLCFPLPLPLPLPLSLPLLAALLVEDLLDLREEWLDLRLLLGVRLPDLPRFLSGVVAFGLDTAERTEMLYFSAKSGCCLTKKAKAPVVGTTCCGFLDVPPLPDRVVNSNTAMLI